MKLTTHHELQLVVYDKNKKEQGGGERGIITTNNATASTASTAIVGVNREGKAISYSNRNELEFIDNEKDLYDVMDDIDLEGGGLAVATCFADLVTPTATTSTEDGGRGGDDGGESYSYDDRRTNDTDVSSTVESMSSADDESIDFNVWLRRGSASSANSTISSEKWQRDHKHDSNRSLLNANVNIDEEIVTKILVCNKSKERRTRRLERGEHFKKMCSSTCSTCSSTNEKCWKRILISLFVIFGSAASVLVTFGYTHGISITDYMGNVTADESDDHESSILLFSDHYDFHKHDDYVNYLQHVILDERIVATVDGTTFPAHIQNKMKNTDERPPLNEDGSITTSSSTTPAEDNFPLFWKVPHSGAEVMEAIMAECFELVLASDVIDDTQRQPDEVRRI